MSPAGGSARDFSQSEEDGFGLIELKPSFVYSNEGFRVLVTLSNLLSVQELGRRSEIRSRAV